MGGLATGCRCGYRNRQNEALSYWTYAVWRTNVWAYTVLARVLMEAHVMSHTTMLRKSGHVLAECEKPADTRVARFWDGFINIVHSQGVGAPSDRWYVVQVEHFIASAKGKRLDAHVPEEVDAYLRRLGASTSLSDWQFRQAVHALQILFCLVVKVPWCRAVDWEYWKGAAQQLGSQHPTLARDYQAVPANDFAAEVRDGGGLQDL